MIVLPWLLALAQAPAPTPQASPAPPTFPAEVRAVEVAAFVSDGGQPVTGLQAGDFELMVDGVRQEPELAAGPGAPVNAILVLDTSASVAGARLDQLKAAGRGLLDALAPKDQATLITFSHDVRLVAPPSEDIQAARAALEAATASGTTALFDAVYASLELADRRQGRPLVLVFSDGEDRLSWLSADQLRAAARSADLVLHAVGLASTAAKAPGIVPYLIDPRGDAARRAEADPAAARRTDLVQDQTRGDLPQILKDLTDLTGGQTWRADDEAQLGQAFLGALSEAKNSYLLRFEPRGVERKGWHKIDLRLKGRKGHVRARRGYFEGPR
jgi:VWFA-related protein